MNDFPSWVVPLLYSLVVILAAALSFLLGRADRAYRRDVERIEGHRATIEDAARKAGMP